MPLKGEGPYADTGMVRHPELRLVEAIYLAVAVAAVVIAAIVLVWAAVSI